MVQLSSPFGYHEDRTPTHGYAATREAAMAAFAKSWRRERMGAAETSGAPMRFPKRSLPA
jgi:hypothetical protein